ncbi:Uncharacterised protein (plasmid) [Mycoplasmopsis cynos]|uniref:Uncharacterized protein n=1 Tax=Mycoplasmopsis cynos TaxID=171284 RepID=A0A449AH43_9BACT|nr:Uncharacterised protein [Mycoplasmopsis cynos]
MCFDVVVDEYVAELANKIFASFNVNSLLFYFALKKVFL